MIGCNSNIVPIQKGDKLNQKQCPKTNAEHKRMKDIPYVLKVGKPYVCPSLYHTGHHLSSRCIGSLPK